METTASMTDCFEVVSKETISDEDYTSAEHVITIRISPGLSLEEPEREKLTEALRKFASKELDMCRRPSRGAGDSFEDAPTVHIEGGDMPSFAVISQNVGLDV